MTNERTWFPFLNYHIDFASISRVHEWLLDISKFLISHGREGEITIRKICIIIQQIWKEGNSTIFHSSVPNVQAMIKRIEIGIIELRMVEQDDSQVSVVGTTNKVQLRDVPSDRDTHWMPPEAGSIKLNCDGAYETYTNRARIGIIARNNQGGLLSAIAKPFQQMMQN